MPLTNNKNNMKNKRQIKLDALISHRFRGFWNYENTVEGLKSALDFGVLLLEFDVRMAKCGTPMVYHDEYAPDKNGNKRFLCDIPAHAYKKIGGRFAIMPTLEAVFSSINHHKNQTAKFLIDIKDLGFETEINALVHYYGLEKRVIYVSWLAEVLYRLHEIAPDIALCFSHWCSKTDKIIAQKHEILVSEDGNIPRINSDYIIGKRMGWELQKPLIGDMLEIIKKTKGIICVPENMINRKLSDYYHKHNIQVSTFSYIGWDKINKHKSDFNIDLYFIDNKQVFTEL